MMRYGANSNEYSYGDDIEVVSNCDDIQVVSPSPISNTTAVFSEEIMTRFRKLVSSSTDDLLGNVVHASSCLEWKDRGSLKGSVSSARKANSMFGRWLEKTSGAESPSSPSPVYNNIERDKIISTNVIFGRGASSVTVAKQYCAVDVHDK